MPALDLIRPSVTAMRVIASVNAEFARELKLPPHIRSLGLISADSDDVTYIADGRSGIWSLAVCGRCTRPVTDCR